MHIVKQNLVIGLDLLFLFHSLWSTGLFSEPGLAGLQFSILGGRAMSNFTLSLCLGLKGSIEAVIAEAQDLTASY